MQSSFPNAIDDYREYAAGPAEERGAAYSSTSVADAGRADSVLHAGPRP